MYFGVPVWPVEWDPPYDEAIKKIAAMGFKGVELIGWNDKWLREYYTKDTIRHLRDLMDSLGVHMTNFNHTPERLSDPDERVRQQTRDTYKRAVEVAHELGAETFTSVSPYPFSMCEAYEPLHHLPLSEEWTIHAEDLNLDFGANYERYVEDLRDFCEWDRQAGLKALIEPHPHRWVHSAASMLRLIEHVGADNLGFNLDPSHLFSAGEFPQRTIYELRGRVWHAHFSDNDTFTNVHWRPGKGKVDWYAVLKALKDTGFDGEISFELEDVPGAGVPGKPCTQRMEYELKESVHYITRIGEELGIQFA